MRLSPQHSRTPAGRIILDQTRLMIKMEWLQKAGFYLASQTSVHNTLGVDLCVEQEIYWSN